MKKSKTTPITSQVIKAFCITCEKTHEIHSTLKKDFKIDTCSNCHPFYLGKQKFESKAGRMERFRQITKKSVALQKNREKLVKPQTSLGDGATKEQAREEKKPEKLATKIQKTGKAKNEETNV